jgi:hypothetical protein
VIAEIDQVAMIVDMDIVVVIVVMTDAVAVVEIEEVVAVVVQAVAVDAEVIEDNEEGFTLFATSFT